MASAQLLPSTVDRVQLDSLVVLKIVKHAETERQSSALVARGYLTGLITDRTLEVTNCFPYAKQLQQADEEEEIAKQQEEMQEMLRRYRQMNIDYQLLGFYESAPFGACFTEHMIESLFDYQSLVEDSVVIVYDPIKTGQGLLTLKAYRLSLAAMDRCYNDFSPESVKAQGLTYENFMEELPIVIKHSHLVNVMLCELGLQKMPKPKQAFLDLGTGGSLETCVKSLMGHIDTLNQEVNRYNKYMANKQKQDQLLESLIQKRRLENESRRARGEAPLPLEDIRKTMKPHVPPSMLDGVLAAAEVNAHVEHTLKTAGQHLGKLFIAESVVEDRPQKERSTSSINIGEK